MTFEEIIISGIFILGGVLVEKIMQRSFFSVHGKKIRKANKVLRKIQTIAQQNNGHARVIGYLRKIDPFVFEELLLTCLKRQGLKIRRNKRYTGDGGIDGRCKIEGYDVLIQAKRYKNHINPKVCCMVKGGGEKFYNLENLKTQPCKQGSPVLPPYDQRCVFKTYKLTIFLSPPPLAKQHWWGTEWLKNT